jgi:hypothetical protein
MKVLSLILMIIAGLCTYYLTCLFMILYRDFKAWREGNDSHAGTRLEMGILKNTLSLNKNQGLSLHEVAPKELRRKINQLRWWRIDQWAFIRRRWRKKVGG